MGCSGSWLLPLADHFWNKTSLITPLQLLTRGAINTMRFKLTKLLLGTTTLWFTSLFSTFVSHSALAAQVYTWAQGQSPTPMIKSDEGVCFLTAVQGKFEGSRERVGVYLENSQWFLGGDSAQVDVAGAANCAYWDELHSPLPDAPFRAIYGPYKWSQGEQTTVMSNMDSRYTLCFLSEVSGKFEGGGEHVEVIDRSGTWQLTGGSKQSGVSAAAYCIPTQYYNTYGPSLTREFTWDQNTPRVPLGSRTPTGYGYSSCFLTRIKGKFEGWGERVNVFSDGSSGFVPAEWYLDGTSYQFDVGASARCY